MTDVEHEEQHHPGVKEYVEIGVILAVLTAIEITLYYAGQAGAPSSVTVPAILFLTAMKFALVVMWFMHLRYDHRVLSRVFVTGMILAAVIFAIVITITILGHPEPVPQA